MIDNSNSSNFNLKESYPSADVGEFLKKKRLKLADTRLGIKDQLPEVQSQTRVEDDADTTES